MITTIDCMLCKSSVYVSFPHRNFVERVWRLVQIENVERNDNYVLTLFTMIIDCFLYVRLVDYDCLF